MLRLLLFRLLKQEKCCLDRQQKLDEIRVVKLSKNPNWKMLSVTFPQKNLPTLLLFIPIEEWPKLQGYPRGSIVMRHRAHFIYDTEQKKFTKKYVEINVSPAEEVLYGHNKDTV